MVLAFAPIAGHHIIGWLVIGAVAGLLAGFVVRGGGMGLIHDIIAGLAGAVLGGLVLHAFTGAHATTSFIGELIVAFAGAVILLAIMRTAARGGGRQRRHIL